MEEIMRDKLRAPMPPESIQQHPTKTFLSTIKAIYVVERLNDVFGIGGWDMTHEIVSDTDDYVAVRGRILYDYDAGMFTKKTPDQYGGHKKIGTNTEPADGYKSAVTDCQSKCASYLEIGIDVFKGLVKSSGQKKAQPEKYESHKSNEKPKDMSAAQRKFIKDLGFKLHEMTADEVAGMVQWKAEQENLTPNHWKVAKILLGDKPEENFTEVFNEYSEHMMNEGQKDDIPY